MPWKPRLATLDDIPELEVLISLSIRTLHVSHYSTAQIEASLGTIYGVDRDLIRDGTYYAVETEGRLVGAGGWSKRASKFGSDAGRSGPNPELNPKTDPARIRAFYVHPAWTRQGIGRAIMVECERAIVAHGFGKVEIIATLLGESLYATFGYRSVERYDLVAPNGLGVPVVRMAKSFEI